MISFSQFLAEAEAEKVITTKEEAQKQLVKFFKGVTDTKKINDVERAKLAMPLDTYIKEKAPSLFTLTYKCTDRGIDQEQFDITFDKKNNELTVRNMEVGNSEFIRILKPFKKDERTWTNLIIKKIVPLFKELRDEHYETMKSHDTFVGYGSQNSGPQ